MGNLQQDPDTVPGLSLAVLTSAVFKIRNDLQRIFYRIMGSSAFNIDDGTDPSVIMFKIRMIQPYRFPFTFFYISAHGKSSFASAQ